MGLSTALTAAKDGARVAVLDANDLGRASSWAGAGVLTPLHPESYPPPLLALCEEGARMWEGFAPEIESSTGIEIGFRRSGFLSLALEAGDVAAARRRFAWWRERNASVEWLAGPALRGGGPRSSPRVLAGIHHPGVRQVRNPRVIRALVAALRNLGATLLPHRPVTGIASSGRSVRIETPSGPIEAGAGVVSAGAWTGALLERAGVPLAVRPVRGQVLLLEKRDLPLRTIVFDDEYVVPRGDGLFLCGATVEEAGFDAAPTDEAIGHLRARAVRLVTGLTSAREAKRWAGLRPASHDGLPYLGKLPLDGNLFVAAGHFRHGLILGPITGRGIARWALSGRAPRGWEPFAPTRERENSGTQA